MIKSNRRFFQANCLLFASVAIWGAWSCAAPDAQPSAEPIVVPPDAPQPDAPPDAPPEEPIAGDPVWRAGFGEATNDQKLFDVAVDPTSNSIVSTFGFIVGITIPGINNDMPFQSGSVNPPIPLTVQNVLVVKHDATTHDAAWAVPIKAGAEIVRSTVDVDFQGNVIVAGGFISKLEIADLPPAPAMGSYDGYLAKFDSAGKPLWVRTFGGTDQDYITDVATDGEGNIVVVGFAASGTFKFENVTASGVTSKDIFIAKYNGMGDAIWAQRVGEAGATDINGTSNWREPTATVEVSRVDGSIFMGGTYRGSLNFPSLPVPAVADEDGFIVKLDKDGNGKWRLKFGSSNCKQRVRSVAIGADGQVALTGSFQGTVMIGTETVTSYKGSEDLLVAMIDDKSVEGIDAQPSWMRHYGSLGDQLGTKVLLDEKGGLFVGGFFTGSIDFFGDGTLTNTTKELPYTPTDIFVSKFKADGTPFWAHAWGDADPKASVGIQTIEGGAFWKNDKDEPFVVFGGINSGLIDFGGAVQFLKTSGLEDAYLMSITY